MILFDDYNLGFFHINKTGGTSVSKFLYTVLGKHTRKIVGEIFHEPLKNKMAVLGEEFDKLSIFTVIRNLYARFVSLYSYRLGRYNRGQKSTPEYKLTHDLSFKDWLKTSPDFTITECIGTIPNNLTIIRLEDLAVDLRNFLSDVINKEIKEDMLHLNRSEHEHYEKYYDDELRQLIYGRERWAFDNFYKEEV